MPAAMILVMIPVLIMGGVMFANTGLESGSGAAFGLFMFVSLAMFVLLTVVKMTYEMDEESDEAIAGTSRHPAHCV